MEITKSLIAGESCDDKLKAFEAEFLSDRLEELGKMSLEPPDFQELRAIGHRWKGFSRPYGFSCLAELGEALEQAAKKEDLKSTESVLGAVERYLQLKKEYLAL